MNIKILVGALAVACIGIIGYTLAHRPAEVSAGKLKVTTSFYPLYFFAQEISGDKASVTNITPAGAEPHDYEPTAQDVARITDSRILILNGGGLEAWGEKIRQNIDPGKTITLIAGEGLTTQEVLEEGEKIIDPHVWLSLSLAQQMVDTIAIGFKNADPEHAAYYDTNAQNLKTKLADLDQAYRTGLAACKSRDFVTSHAAFGYLATTYGLRQVAISGISPDVEPSPQQLAEVTKFARDNNVKYIFFEGLISPRLSQTIATEVGAQTLVLNPIEGLTPEDLAEGKNYLTEMQDNLTNLKIALQCQ